MTSTTEPANRPVAPEQIDRGLLATPSAWWRVTTAGAAALILAAGFLAVFWYLARPLALLFIGATLAAALAPVVAWLERRLPRTLAVLLVFLAVLLLLFAMGWVIFPALVGQAQDAIDRLPEFVDRARSCLESRLPLGDFSLTDTLTSQLSQAGSSLLAVPLALVSSVVDVLLIVVIAVYGLLLLPRMAGFVRSLFPDGRAERVTGVLAHMGQAMGGYVRGTVLNGLLVGLLTFVGLLIIGVDYAAVLGLLAGLLEIIPVLGPTIAMVPIVGIALLDSPIQALIAFIYMVVLHQLENHLIVPNIMRSQADVSPLLVILALFAGSSVAGIAGALVAIPLAAALRVFVLEVLAPAIRAWSGAQRRAEPEEENNDE